MFCRITDCRDDQLTPNLDDVAAGNQMIAALLRMTGITTEEVLLNTTAKNIAKDGAVYYALHVCALRTIDLETPLSSKIDYYKKLYDDAIKLLNRPALGLSTVTSQMFATIDTERA